MTLEQRFEKLAAALREIAEIAEVSDGPAARFYGMRARKALQETTDKEDKG